MADTMTLEPTVKEATELQAEISYYLTEMGHLNELMAQDQKRIDALKVETRVIAVETRLLMESLQGTLRELSAA
jgi:hypothetical protein